MKKYMIFLLILGICNYHTITPVGRVVDTFGYVDDKMGSVEGMACEVVREGSSYSHTCRSIGQGDPEDLRSKLESKGYKVINPNRVDDYLSYIQQ